MSSTREKDKNWQRIYYTLNKNCLRKKNKNRWYLRKYSLWIKSYRNQCFFKHQNSLRKKKKGPLYKFNKQHLINEMIHRISFMEVKTFRNQF